MKTESNADNHTIVRSRKKLRAGGIFSGIGAIEYGFEEAGFRFEWLCEAHAGLREFLQRRGSKVYPDVRSLLVEGPSPVDLICGGDPCPKHSRARSNGDSIHPDLAGYFLAVAGGLRPAWVVRENVPAPTVNHFDAALGALGYGTVVIRMDAAEITGQSRQRDIVVGRYQATRQGVRSLFSDCEDGPGPYTTRLGKRGIVPALTTHRARYDSRDCYVWEPGRGLRILDGDEREALAGLPPGWTSEFSETARARVCGNSSVPHWFYWIGKRIIRAERSTEQHRRAV